MCYQECRKLQVLYKLVDMHKQKSLKNTGQFWMQHEYKEYESKHSNG